MGKGATASLAAASLALAMLSASHAGTLTGRDLFALQYAADPEIRADGRQIAYVRVSYDPLADKARRSIWLIDAATGEQAPMGGSPASQSSPRWSPAGDRLAFVSADENSRAQLWVRWLASGAAAKLADLPSAPGDITWSPDGRTIGFSMLVETPAPTLGLPIAKPEGAQWAAPLKIIDQVHYREDGEGYLKPGQPPAVHGCRRRRGAVADHIGPVRRSGGHVVDARRSHNRFCGQSRKQLGA